MRDKTFSIRLSEAEARLLEKLRAQLGLSKSAIVRIALASMVSDDNVRQSTSLYTLGRSVFGRHGEASKQSACIKQVIRREMHARRSST